MKATFTIVFLGASVFLWGQKTPLSVKHESNQVYEIDVYTAHKNKLVYPLSTIAERIEYIPLEKTDQCFIETIYNPCVTSSDIFVFDFKSCYRFDRQGRFLNRIGKSGRGPEEVVRPFQMAVDSSNRWVYLLDMGSERIVKYSYEGKHIESFKLDFNSVDMILYQDGVLLLDDMFYQHAKPGKRYSLKFYSTQAKKVIAQMACEKKDKIPFSMCNPSMYRYNGQTYVKDYWDDIIYYVQDPGNLQAYALINIGRFKHRDSDDNSPITGKTSSKDKMVFDVTFSAETDRYIFLVGSKGLFFYDKFSNNTFCSDFIKGEEDWFSFSNDLNGGPNMKSNNFPKLRFDDNTLVTYHHAYEFFDTEGDESPEVKTLKSKLSPDDNPVLALIHIRK